MQGKEIENGNTLSCMKNHEIKENIVALLQKICTATATAGSGMEQAPLITPPLTPYTLALVLACLP